MSKQNTKKKIDQNAKDRREGLQKIRGEKVTESSEKQRGSVYKDLSEAVDVMNRSCVDAHQRLNGKDGLSKEFSRKFREFRWQLQQILQHLSKVVRDPRNKPLVPKRSHAPTCSEHWEKVQVVGKKAYSDSQKQVEDIAISLSPGPGAT